MNLKEKLVGLKARAEEIRPRVEGGEKSAMEEAAKLVAEIDEVKAAIAEAEKFQAAIKGIGSANAEYEAPSKSVPRTLGDFVAAGVKSKGKPQKSAVSYGTFMGAAKAAGDQMTKPAGVDSALAPRRPRRARRSPTSWSPRPSRGPRHSRLRTASSPV